MIGGFDIARTFVIAEEVTVIVIYIHMLIFSFRNALAARSRAVQMVWRGRVALSVGVLLIISASLHGMVGNWGDEMTVRVPLATLACIALVAGYMYVVNLSFDAEDEDAEPRVPFYKL